MMMALTCITSIFYVSPTLDCKGYANQAYQHSNNSLTALPDMGNKLELWRARNQGDHGIQSLHAVNHVNHGWLSTLQSFHIIISRESSNKPMVAAIYMQSHKCNISNMIVNKTLPPLHDKMERNHWRPSSA
eukprot:3624495-Prorocentrum_lima.AAC.2